MGAERPQSFTEETLTRLDLKRGMIGQTIRAHPALLPSPTAMDSALLLQDVKERLARRERADARITRAQMELEEKRKRRCRASA